MSRRSILGVILLPVMAVLAGCSGAPPASDAISQAVKSCELEANRSVTVGDAGKSLTIDGLSQETRVGLATARMGCLFAALGTPDAVLSQMTATRALDGRQEATWTTNEGAALKASWTYHPDDGLDVIVTEGA